MSDRKYKQRGYQDDQRDRGPKGPKSGEAPPKERAPGGRRSLQDESGPRTPNLMAAHEVFRCARCGNRLALDVEPLSRCSRCGVDLHSCVQCVSFDTSARWECAQPAIPARVSPKDVANSCEFFAARTTVERETGTTGPTTARQAFDDLFK
jgi:hypothetical protein